MKMSKKGPMRVCLLGDFAQDEDEGLRKTSKRLLDALERLDGLEIIPMTIRNSRPDRLLSRVRSCSPDIIHWIPGPTNRSLLFCRLAAAGRDPPPRLFFQATRPRFSPRIFHRLVGSRGCLVATPGCFPAGNSDGVPVRTVSPAVDCTRFHPAAPGEMEALREKWGLEPGRPTLLHVGHLAKTRNLELLAPLCRDYQVVVAASRYFPADPATRKRLEAAGCHIIDGYIPCIEEFYRLSDAYIFPVHPGDSISCPLSVLEAMATDIPVVTTRFPEIEAIAGSAAGCIFFDDAEDLPAATGRAMKAERPAGLRPLVESLSWERTAREILSFYCEEPGY
jgi:glycosyltransferase involved in cell wall biosynthesis